MDHLALEIFGIGSTDSKYAFLPDDTSITITDSSEIFGKGDVWSFPFTLSIPANAHIFGSSGDMHGARLHEQIDKRRARLWVDGLPLYFGYLKLGSEASVSADGDVSVTFESGLKTFEDSIDGVSAQEVSVGDVVIGIAMNRKRIVKISGEGNAPSFDFILNGLEAYRVKNPELGDIDTHVFTNSLADGQTTETPYAQRWPKLVKSDGYVYDSNKQKRSVGSMEETRNCVNIHEPYGKGHEFCNINICYPMKVYKSDESEVPGRGYTVRLAHGEGTVAGGDNETRFNNAPNFYLLYFIDRLFKDLGITVEENQAKDVEDIRRVFMLNFGCHYEEIEDTYSDTASCLTPADKLGRYGQYYIPLFSGSRTYGGGYTHNMVYTLGNGCVHIAKDSNVIGKVLLRDIVINGRGSVAMDTMRIGSVEGRVTAAHYRKMELSTDYAPYGYDYDPVAESYPGYLAYATGENYPKVEISEIIEAMKAMFGIRLVFSNDYKRVRIVLLRNIFNSFEVQDVACEVSGRAKTENSIRGFRMTYGKGTGDTTYYYKRFNDMFQRAATIWKDTTDKHDYSQIKTDADYGTIKQSASAMNRTCYVTPVNGNAYVTKVDENEDVLFPSVFEVAGYMDAEDGDCSGESETVEEVKVGATPVIMNDVNGTYAALFSGEMKPPVPLTADGPKVTGVATMARMTTESLDFHGHNVNVSIDGKLDIFYSEGYYINLQDNYSISNGGTPFDEADPGLCFGIMRGSGADARVSYFDDNEDSEGNRTWETVPGKGAIDHPDACDSYGNGWLYNGSQEGTVIIKDGEEARAALSRYFADSNAIFSNMVRGHITKACICQVTAVSAGNRTSHNVLMATGFSYGQTMTSGEIADYRKELESQNLTIQGIKDYDRNHRGIIVETDSSYERQKTLVDLCEMAYGKGTTPIVIDDGVSARYGRFSLKLRAEKPNPFYVEGSQDGDKKDKYLKIDDGSLRGRGLCDQFYKEYSYFVRNARIANITATMELAQLLSIDKTKRVRVGDIMGFIRKMKYTVSKRNGLGDVELEIMYI